MSGTIDIETTLTWTSEDLTQLIVKVDAAGVVTIWYEHGGQELTLDEKAWHALREIMEAVE